MEFFYLFYFDGFPYEESNLLQLTGRKLGVVGARSVPADTLRQGPVRTLGG